MVPLIILALLLGLVAFKAGSRKLRGKITTWHEEAKARGCDLDLTHRAPSAHSFDLFDAVSDRKVWTTVTRPGSDDSAFLYRFDVRTGDSDHKHRRSCALIELPFMAPKTTLRPHALQTAPSKPTDGEDLPLGIDAFDSVFRLQVSDSDFARRLFRSDFPTWLLSPEGKCGEIEFELRDNWLLCSGPQAADINELIDFLDWSQNVRDRAAVAFATS